MANGMIVTLQHMYSDFKTRGIQMHRMHEQKGHELYVFEVFEI
jgi:hypothetical protein